MANRYDCHVKIKGEARKDNKASEEVKWIDDYMFLSSKYFAIVIFRIMMWTQLIFSTFFRVFWSCCLSDRAFHKNILF